MTPEQAIKRDILLLIKANEKDNGIKMPRFDTPDEIDDTWEIARINDWHWDAMEDFRTSYYQETNITSELSRHYDSMSVAKQLSDGRWIGYTYWYGGGKYGEPEAMDWMEYAYFLECKEEEKMVTVRTFSKLIDKQ